MKSVPGLGFDGNNFYPVDRGIGIVVGIKRFKSEDFVSIFGYGQGRHRDRLRAAKSHQEMSFLDERESQPVVVLFKSRKKLRLAVRSGVSDGIFPPFMEHFEHDAGRLDIRVADIEIQYLYAFIDGRGRQRD